MVHPATARAVRTAVTSLNLPLDVGSIFPPRPGQVRGFGAWQHRDLGVDDILALLPRLAAENVRGGAIYMRLGPGASKVHPGLTMIDDLDADAVQRLHEAGLEPCLVVQTSPGNFQAWIRLIASGTVPYATMNAIARQLAEDFDGDPRAVSPRQPGRLPGFTNRKAKYARQDGTFPFARILSADPGRVASNGRDLIAKLTSCTAGGARRAPAETPRKAAQSSTHSKDMAIDAVSTELDKLYSQAHSIILGQIARGSRPKAAGSASEIDFLFARLALEAGCDPELISDSIATHRPDKASGYPGTTVRKATDYVETNALTAASQPGR